MARAFVVWVVILMTAGLQAQSTVSISGVVVDEAGGVIPGARVSFSSLTAVVGTAITDGRGEFTVPVAALGTYDVLVEMPLFASARESVSVGAGGGDRRLRIVLRAGGYAESVVVTGRRDETRLTDTPQKIEVVDETDIARSAAADVTDLLKKNAGVDVIQYTGALSGIGLRGFRPQFSGINKRSLLLVDGRPSGVTNLATVPLDEIERVEVLKGAASSIYGSSAMGGVVNLITRRSRGPIAGRARVGIGSFGVSDFSARAGGSAGSIVDFDATGDLLNQRDDLRMGNGEIRPATTYRTQNGALRAGVDLGGGWRADARGDAYRGIDINTPGDLATGVRSQGRKNLDRQSFDGRVTGRTGSHELMVTAYRANEAGQTFNVTTTNALDIPYLPYLTFESELDWMGLQARDSWNWSRIGDLVFGLDYEKVTSVSRSFTRTGERSAPFSSDSNKRTTGMYGEQTLKLWQGGTIVALGGRLDRITTATLDTPLKTNFTPSEAIFTVFNPSLGIKQRVGALAGRSRLLNDVRAHFTIGRAFVPAEASMLTGYTTTVVSGRTTINQGNPDLRPERSTSMDLGLEWTTSSRRVDATFFRTVVSDRFISNVAIGNPQPSDPIVLSTVNGLDAHISGVDFEAEQRLGAHAAVFANLTHYYRRKERLATGGEQDILNVALNTVRAGVDLDVRRVSGRLMARYVQGRKDNDFNAPGFPIVDYADFTVVDGTVSYRVARQHAVDLSIGNLGDAFYYEKIGFPQAGRSLRLSYAFGF